jgi:peptidoglycan/xylan/chitin deacetylase (PgdA/CDA1 family)
MLIKNFLFHRVSEEADQQWPPMKPSHFRRIIRYLTQQYAVVPLENFLADPGAFKTKKRLATILFDDGFKDNIEQAAPILASFKCPASFYIVTDCIDRNIPTWTYLLDDLLTNTRKERIELPFDFVPEKMRSVQLRQEGHHEPSSKMIKPFLKKLRDHQRRLIIGSLAAQCDDVEKPAGKMMSWDDIRQLAGEGFIIGSHSNTHPLLASLETEKDITDELRISGRRIEQETRKFPLTISYPIGSFDKRVTRIAAEEGYKYGLAVEQRFYQTEKDDRFAIPRVELYQESNWKTKMRINGIYGRLKKILRK